MIEIQKDKGQEVIVDLMPLENLPEYLRKLKKKCDEAENETEALNIQMGGSCVVDMGKIVEEDDQ